MVPALVVEATGKYKLLLSSLYTPSLTVFRFTNNLTRLAFEAAPSPTTTVRGIESNNFLSAAVCTPAFSAVEAGISTVKSFDFCIPSSEL